MKSLYQAAIASVLVLLMGFMPATAYASKNTGTAHSHTQTYHDRTPAVHSHTAHHHR